MTKKIECTKCHKMFIFEVPLKDVSDLCPNCASSDASFEPFSAAAEKPRENFCLNCNKKISFRGLCSTKCHNEYYDSEYAETDASHGNEEENTGSNLEGQTPSDAKKSLDDVEAENSKKHRGVHTCDGSCLKKIFNKHDKTCGCGER